MVYFKNVRKTNPFRQRIGWDDMIHSIIPKFNPKKEKPRISCSMNYIKETLNTLPKEYEKLKRWKKFKNESYKKLSKGKVIFGTGKEFKLSI